MTFTLAGLSFPIFVAEGLFLSLGTISPEYFIVFSSPPWQETSGTPEVHVCSLPSQSGKDPSQYDQLPLTSALTVAWVEMP